MFSLPHSPSAQQPCGLLFGADFKCTRTHSTHHTAVLQLFILAAIMTLPKYNWTTTHECVCIKYTDIISMATWCAQHFNFVATHPLCPKIHLRKFPVMGWEYPILPLHECSFCLMNNGFVIITFDQIAAIRWWMPHPWAVDMSIKEDIVNNLKLNTDISIYNCIKGVAPPTRTDFSWMKLWMEFEMEKRIIHASHCGGDHPWFL